MLAIVSISVLVLRFFVFSRNSAQLLIIAGGYWIMLTGALLYAVHLYRYLCIKWSLALWKKYRIGVVVAALGAVFLQTHEPRQFKVLFDEFTFSGVARNMHFFRQAAFPTRIHLVDDGMNAMESAIDRRPLFFQFTLACVHDVTGYRPENVFYLNAVVAFFLLLITYCFGVKYGGASLGITLVGLWLGLPLLAQNATGGGYDIFNLLMLAIFWFFGLEYLRSGTLLAQNLFILTAVHLAQVRYESILYIIPMAAIIMIKCFRDRTIKLGWVGVMFPLGLLLPLLINLAFVQTPGAFQTNPGQSFFSLQYFPDNLERAFRYLFDPSFAGSNSIILSAFGIVAVIAVSLRLVSRWRDLVWNGEDALLGGLLLVVLLNVLLVLCNFWGQWDDPVATRFSLPLHLLFIWCIGYSLKEMFTQRAIPVWVPVVAVVSGLVLSTAAAARSYPTREMLPGREYAWLFEEIAKPSHQGALIIAHPVGPIVYGHAAVGMEVAEAAKWKIHECLRLGLYPEILALERVCIDVTTGQEVPYDQAKGWDIKSLGSAGSSVLSNAFKKQIVAEVHWRPGVISRVVRIVGVEAEPPAISSSEPPLAMSGKQRWDQFHSVLP